MKLLIVDDSKFIRENIKLRVKDLNIDMVEASNGEEAFEVYKEEQPDLVFMDIIMKKIDDGVTAIKNIKQYNPDARIVVITSLGENDDFVRAAVDLGVLDVITKPFKKEELFRYLNPSEQFKSKFE